MRTQAGEGEKPSALRRLVYRFGIGFPLGLTLVSAAGYNYTARQFWIAFAASVTWILLLLVAGALLNRYVALARRTLAIREAQKKREEDERGTPGAPAAISSADGPAVDRPSAAAQSNLLQWQHQIEGLIRLFLVIGCAVVLWKQWAQFLPALQSLDAIPVWSRDVAVQQTQTQGGPVQVVPGVPAGAEQQPPKIASAMDDGPGAPVSRAPYVSVWDLLAALVIGILTLAASRNLPGLIGMTVLSRLRLAPGEDYAITTIARYVILLVGLLLVAGHLGLSWTKVQWLAAAVTVGIGFGLQEIFANFVSGLILLFERPVRIGDVVTVGDVSGAVTRIQIRATTIREWDNKELVLPNKELVTGRFVNWTLTDQVTRIVCTVGVGYETDVRKVQQLLLEIARKNPNVLAEPAPNVALESFGDSSLNFVLRAHVATLSQRLPTIHELNATILEEFRRAGIEIPYPQRDLHLRTLPPGFPGRGGPDKSA